MKRDQKGFTIVELLIAVAILAIVVASVCGFILVGSRSYAAGNSDISVQQEAQLALNQMSDVVIDTTRSVTYTGFDAGGTTSETALKDAEFSFTPEDKSLVMLNGTAVVNPGGGPNPIIEEGNGNRNYHFYWDKSEETLFYAEAPVADPVPDFGDPTADWVTLASHVTDFSVDLSQVEEKRVVMLALTFEDGVKEYVTSNNVTIRNKVGVNDAELEAINKKKTLMVTPRDNPIIEPGETYHFSTPKVTGENVTDRSVTWSLQPSADLSSGTVFTDTTNGILKVAENQKAGVIKVVITTNAVDSDGNHASCTMDVHIKRVTDVVLAKTADSDTDNGPNEISPGCTFTITADVQGYKLGEVCSECGDDVSVDKQVIYQNNPYGLSHIWRIYDPSSENGATTKWNPNEYIEIIESEADHATFRMKNNAPTSDDKTTYGVVIQCISTLSELDNAHGRHYSSWVPGAIEFRMVKSKKNIGVDGSIRWGVKVGLWHEIDYPEDFNGSGQGYFLIFARVREEGTTGGDKIMVYRTTGINSEVTPDMFGVEDISKPWYLSLQVLDPGQHIQQGVGPSKELLRDLDQQIHDQLVKDVVADYLANCVDGTYVGTKYPHTDKFEGRILPPEIYYAYDGQTNLGGELRLKPVTTLAGPETTEFNVDYVKNTRDERDKNHFTNRSVKFSAYKENGGTLEKIYWYNAEGNYYEGNSSPYNGALRFDEIKSATNTKIKLDFNRKEMFSQAAGKYRIIPTITYYQDPGADTSYTIYYANYQPNYWSTQSYEVPASTVYYELINGGNLELWSYAYDKFTKGEIYFPTPQDAGFTSYFDRESIDWKKAKKLDNFKKTINGSSDTTIYQPSSMRCRYVKDKGVYELELFYYYTDSVWNREVEVSAGVFQCAADGKRWERKDRGSLDTQLESGNMTPPINSGSTADMGFTMDGSYYQGKMYLPLPSEKAFIEKLGFSLKQSTLQTGEWKSLRYQEPQQTDAKEIKFPKMTCAYDAATDTYTLELFGQNGQKAAAYTCKSNGTAWTKQ